MTFPLDAGPLTRNPMRTLHCAVTLTMTARDERWNVMNGDLTVSGTSEVADRMRVRTGTKVRRFRYGICSSTARIENRTSSNSSSNCAPQGLQILLCAPLHSIENTCAPAFMNRLLTEGL